jgi:Probable Zinc-ribbon domain
MNKSTTQEFITKSIEIHGDKYNYSLVIYIRNDIPVKIICNICDEIFEQKPTHHLQKHGCLYCSGKIVGKNNSLFHKYPTLAEEWHPSKNDELLPTQLTSNSRKKVWWLCAYKHEWIASPNNRIQSGIEKKCGFCLNQRVHKDNCLSTVDPQLASELHPTKNDLNADQIIYGSNKKFWWLCSICKYEWKTGVDKRIRIDAPTGCPQCANHYSEHGVYFSIKNNIDIKYDSSWEKERMMEYDNTPSIIQWKKCSDKIKFFDSQKNKWRKYNPDFEITYNSGIVIIEEIKGIFPQKLQDYILKFRVAQEFYLKQNKQYKMITKINRWKPHDFVEISLHDLLKLEK